MAVESLILSYLPLLGIFDGIMETVSHVGLAYQLMIFSYLLFWFYYWFREAPILLGIAAIMAFFFIFIQPILTNTLLVLFIIFVTLGNHLQILVQFGLYPLLRFFGIELEHPEMAEQQKIHSIENKLKAGVDLQDDEEKFLENIQRRDAQYQKKMQDRMMRYY